jgi:hypothetical protein
VNLKLQPKVQDHKTMSDKLIHSATSVQLRVPIKESTQILTWSNKHIHNNDLYIDENDPSYGRDTHSHITICGGLPCDSHLEVQKITSSIQPLEINFGKLNIWNSKKYDVLSIKVYETTKLNLLRGQVKKLQTKGYYPGEFHCTIAYVKLGVVQKLDLSEHENILNNVKCISDELEYVKRDGSILSFPISGPPPVE